MLVQQPSISDRHWALGSRFELAFREFQELKLKIRFCPDRLSYSFSTKQESTVRQPLEIVHTRKSSEQSSNKWSGVPVRNIPNKRQEKLSPVIRMF
jgi:hypothetical protein